MNDLISRQAAIDALWKALYEYEDKTEKQFIESDELDINDWIQHRIFVQNMSDIDRQTIQNLPIIEVEPVKHGQWRDTGSGQECSVCGEIQYGYDSYRNYCANCGARMDGKEE